ncbi:MAG: hypothetical protein Q8T09_24015 [Candidatus Melainabacteria bacterium]|nr:hypothetical protein [Candidatus Melainabacteria bacterium]
MEPSTSSELQQLSGYSADCIVDILRIVVAVLHIGISLAPLVAIILLVLWWKKVQGKSRSVGVVTILASTAFICVGGWFLTGMLNDRLTLIRTANELLKAPP